MRVAPFPTFFVKKCPFFLHCCPFYKSGSYASPSPSHPITLSSSPSHPITLTRSPSHPLTLQVPVEYNILPPSVTCLTRLWHPNISEDGQICLSLLRPHSVDGLGWAPTR